MTERESANPLETPTTPAGAANSASGNGAARPDYLPEKFWNAAKGEARLEPLARSYGELERKLGGGEGVPSDPSAYRIESKDAIIAADPEVNARLHKAGFSQAQAQLVYDLAAERLMPMLNEVASQFETENQTERLTRHFGGAEKWRETSRQIAAWGRANMPQSAFAALSSTYEGVVALHKMMSGNEPGLVRGEGAGGALTEESLREMTRDPRYWRDLDPGVVARVTEGFKRLYPDTA